MLTKLGVTLTLAMLLGTSVAAAQATPTKQTKPTQIIPVMKEPAHTDTAVKHDTVIVTRRDTIRLMGPTVTVTQVEVQTRTVVKTPGWMDRGQGWYVGLGAGPYYPSGGLGGGQIPGYAFQGNVGIDPAGSPFGLRVTLGAARPDEAQGTANLGARPLVVNLTGDLKLRFFSGTKFPFVSLYGVGGVAMVDARDLRMEQDPGKVVVLTNHSWQRYTGWDAGGGASVQLGHKRELFLEARAINFKAAGFENAHQLPVILGVNWY